MIERPWIFGNHRLSSWGRWACPGLWAVSGFPLVSQGKACVTRWLCMGEPKSGLLVNRKLILKPGWSA